MEKVRAIARQVSNWGRWGADDERGTLNFITPEVVQRAGHCIKRGAVFSLGLRFEASDAERLAWGLGLERRVDSFDEACRYCGYPLEGLNVPTCPGCGKKLGDVVS